MTKEERLAAIEAEVQYIYKTENEREAAIALEQSIGGGLIRPVSCHAGHHQSIAGR